jgi:hypothetical protein
MKSIRTQAALLVLAVVLIAGYLSFVTWSGVEASEKRGPLHKTHTETIREELLVGSEETLNLQSFNGKVEVKGWDRDTIQLVAEKRMEIRRSGKKLFRKQSTFESESDAQAYFAELGMDIRQGGDEIQVQTVRPQHRRGVELSVRYEIYVPQTIGVSVETSNGSVLVENIRGPVSAHSSNGRIHINDTSGPVTVRTSNGKVLCEAVSNSIDAQTSNGAITVLHPTSLAQTDRIKCRTSNGGIRLGIMAESDFAVEADTTNGNIRSDFDIAGKERRRGRTHLAGVVGTGNTTVTLRTSNGPIKIEKL